MKLFMTIRQARLLGRSLAKELNGVSRCKFEGLEKIEMTCTKHKSYIEMFNPTLGEVFAVRYLPYENNHGCIPYNWQTKPRGAAHNEWQHITEDFVEETIKKYNVL